MIQSVENGTKKCEAATINEQETIIKKNEIDYEKYELKKHEHEINKHEKMNEKKEERQKIKYKSVKSKKTKMKIVESINKLIKEMKIENPEIVEEEFDTAKLPSISFWKDSEEGRIGFTITTFVDRKKIGKLGWKYNAETESFEPSSYMTQKGLASLKFDNDLNSILIENIKDYF